MDAAARCQPPPLWPVGSSVALTDSIPLTALTFKLLDPVLPPVFQYIGLWLVACYALQGLFGALLMQLATPRPVLQGLGAVFFVLSPPFIVRFGHEALTAHWVLLAALWLSLRPGAERVRPGQTLAWVGLSGVTAAIHPVPAADGSGAHGGGAPAAGGAASRHLAWIAASGAVALATAWLALWQGGSFVVPSDGGLAVGGFGDFSANLLTFVLPTVGQSLFWPGPVPYASALQNEGYAYLGAGLLLLGVVAAVVSAARPAATRDALRAHWPTALAVLVLAAFAVGPVVTAGPQTLVTYDGGVWGALAIFRAHGRLIWPLFYLLLVWTLFTVARLRPAAALVLLGGGLLVQAADLAGMTRFVADAAVWGYRDPLVSRFWDTAAPHHDRIVMVPTNVCDRDGALDNRSFTLLAGRHGLALNAGSTARYDVGRARAYCAELDADVRAGRWGDRTLYILRPDLLPALAPSGRSDGPVCGVVDGVGVCVTAASVAAWKDEFTLPPQ